MEALIEKKKFTRAQLRRGEAARVLLLDLFELCPFICTNNEQNIRTLFSGAACARDIYTLLLSVVADRWLGDSLYELALALWENYSYYSPLPRWPRADRTVVFVNYSPFSSRARYTVERPFKDGATLILVARSVGGETEWDRKAQYSLDQLEPLRRITTGQVKLVRPAIEPERRCVIYCCVFRRVGREAEWDTKTERLARFDRCLHLVDCACIQFPIKRVSFPRQIGDEISAREWPKWEETVHRWANDHPQIEVLINL